MSVIRNSQGKALYETPYPNAVSEGTLTGGNSPFTFSVQAAIGKHGLRGYVSNDGSTAITVQLSNNGTFFNTAFSLLAGEKLDLTGMDVHSVKLTRGSSDAAYRINVW